MPTILDDISEITDELPALSAEDTTLINVAWRKAERLVKKFLGYNVVHGTYTEYYPMRDQALGSDNLIEGYEVQGNRAVAYGNQIGRNRLLIVKQLPLRSIQSLYENIAAFDTPDPGQWPADTLMTEGADYQLDLDSTGLSWTGMVFRRSGAWAETPRCIKIAYTAGLTAAELEDDYPEFKEAVIQTAVILFNSKKYQQGLAAGGSGVGPVISTTLGKFSESYAAGAATDLFGMVNDLPASAKKILAERVNMRKFLPL